MDFWAGVRHVWDGNGRGCWRLADGRVISYAEMEQRERLYKAGRDPDAPWTPDGDGVDTVLGPVVAMRRAMRGLTQRDLAMLAGVSQRLDAMRREPVVDVREVKGRSQTTAPSSVSSSDGGP